MAGKKACGNPAVTEYELDVRDWIIRVWLGQLQVSTVAGSPACVEAGPGVHRHTVMWEKQDWYFVSFLKIVFISSLIL